MKKNIKKIMLVFPPTVTSIKAAQYVCPPLGIAYLASVLRNDYEIKLLDATVEGYENEEVINQDSVRFGLSYSAIKEEIARFNPDVLGITCLYSSQFPSVVEICRACKNINPNMVTVSGGPHPTYLPARCLEKAELDFIIIGEGEYTFQSLIQRMEKGKEFHNIDGLAYRSNGGVCVNPKTQFIENLDDIPYPARDLLPMKKYFTIDLPMGITSKKTPSTSLITSRGCPMSCAFCSSFKFWGNKYRTRSPKNVIGEIEQLIEKYGIKELKFHDDNLTIDKKRAEGIFREMASKRFDLSWTAPNGLSAWTLNDNILGLMKASGCYEVTLAIESGDEKVLREIVKKPTNLENIKETIKNIKKLGMNTSAFFIIGFPGETKNQINKTLSFAEKIRVDRISIMLANPLPGTAMLDMCLEKGLIDKNYPFEDNDYCKARITLPDISGKEIEKIRNRWFLKCNLRSFFRNPFKFFLRYGKFIFTRPFDTLDIIHLKKTRLKINKLARGARYFIDVLLRKKERGSIKI